LDSSYGPCKSSTFKPDFNIQITDSPQYQYQSHLHHSRQDQLVANDPMLWLILMLMPNGPPATKLVALADISGADEDEKMSIAKFLTVSYAVSPVICFAVVGSLKASLAVSRRGP